MHATVANKTPVPEAITTPSTVKAGIGALEFTDGYPKNEAAELHSRSSRAGRPGHPFSCDLGVQNALGARRQD